MARRQRPNSGAQRNPEEYGPPEKVLLVEGPEDQHFLWNLLEAKGYQEGVRITRKDGYTRVRESFAARLKTGENSHLGIMVDSDTDCAARWQSLRDVLTRAGYSNVPRMPVPGGAIIQPDEPDSPGWSEIPYKTVVGIWLMPDNTSAGLLEDFAYTLRKPDDPLWGRAIQAVTDIPAEERRFSELARRKAEVHTWLAWQEEPGEPMGRAIKQGYLQTDAEPARALVSWLCRLYNLKPAARRIKRP